MMRPGIPLLALVLVASCRGSCQPPPPPPPNACEGAAVPSIGPGTGSLTICVLPSDCREDTMTQLIDASYCADKSAGYCPAQNAACAGGNCGGAVLSSGLTVAPGACSWDRNSECKTSTGAAGGKCTCNWTIPAGAILQCGCGCK